MYDIVTPDGTIAARSHRWLDATRVADATGCKVRLPRNERIARGVAMTCHI